MSNTNSSARLFALLSFVVAPSSLRAQEPAARPQTSVSTDTATTALITVCVVPGSGTVYRIGLTGTPNACLQASHTRTSFNAGGPQGLQGVAGVQGDAGAAGPQGTTGGIGATGAVGIAGVAGIAGATGVAGATGIAGATGVAGATGIAGAAGSAGAAGIAGTPGVAGEAGIAGAVGSPGAAGSPGIAGTPGLMGPPGLIGPKGLTGLTGPQGPAGPAGAGVTGWQLVQVLGSNVGTSLFSVYATCPTGKAVVGGGAEAFGSGLQTVITGSAPNSSAMWVGTGFSKDGSSMQIRVSAVCVDAVAVVTAY